MVFSSFSFIFVFLPIVLAIYFLVKDKYKNICICIASLIFYAWGEPKNIILMLLSVLVNYWFAIYIGKQEGKRKSYYLFLILYLTLVLWDFLNMQTLLLII